MRFEELTVLLPTRNEVHNIAGFLDSLPPSVALVVVDSSHDGTPELIRRLRPGHTIVVQRDANVTRARQLGAAIADSPWLLFTDADVAFGAGYFERLAKYVDYDAVYGAKLSRGEFSTYYSGAAFAQGISHRLGAPAASGSNMLIRKRAFNAVGGFDMRLTCNEDSEIMWRVKRRGLRVKFARDLEVYVHDHRRLERGVAKKSLHSLLRCGLLYFNVMPQRWRSRDWGYWARTSSRPGEGSRSPSTSP